MNKKNVVSSFNGIFGGKHGEKRKTSDILPSYFPVLILSRLNLGRISSFKSGKSEDLSVVKIDPFAKQAFVLLCQTKKKHRTLKDL